MLEDEDCRKGSQCGAKEPTAFLLRNLAVVVLPVCPSVDLFQRCSVGRESTQLHPRQEKRQGAFMMVGGRVV